MTALAAARNTPSFASLGFASYPLADNVKIYQGALVVLSAGYAQPATSAVGLVAVGRARTTVDNTVTGHTLGGLSVEVEQGTFRWVNGDSIAQAQVGARAYMTDDQTVAKTAGTKSVAGIITAVDSSGVWVHTSQATAEVAQRQNIQTGTGTLSSGVLTVATGITVTASSKVFVTCNTPGAAVSGSRYVVKDADLVVGAPGTGTIIVRAMDLANPAAAVTTDVSTINYMIVG